MNIQVTKQEEQEIDESDSQRRVNNKLFTTTRTTKKHLLLSSSLPPHCPLFFTSFNFLTPVLLRHMSASPEFNRPPPSPGLLLPSIPLPVMVVSPLPSNNVEVNADGDYEEEECRTPTSEDSRLPPVNDSCPPPPPRKTRCAAPRKRRLSTKLIAVGAEELEQLFGWERSFSLDRK